MIDATSFLANIQQLEMPSGILSESAPQECDGNQDIDKTACSTGQQSQDDAADESSEQSSYSHITKTRTYKKSCTRFKQSDKCALVDAHSEHDCKEAALRLLDRRTMSVATLRERLSDKGYHQSVIDPVVTRLEELQLLDDTNYAQTVLRSCFEKMMGYKGAVEELRRKGVPRTKACELCDQAKEEGLFDKALYRLADTVLRRSSNVDITTLRRRFWAAAGRRGHEGERVSQVARELLSLR